MNQFNIEGVLTKIICSKNEKDKKNDKFYMVLKIFNNNINYKITGHSFFIPEINVS